MDWASSEWKEGLSPLAFQKVSALEEQVAKLQKERQLKLVQFECLQSSFDKEKTKVEQEKLALSEKQQELQLLANNIQDLEKKQQKLQVELQGRDSKIQQLQALLNKSKSENSQLQQANNVLKDMRSIKEEREAQKRLSLSFEQIKTPAKGENAPQLLTEDSPMLTLQAKVAEQEALISELRTQILNLQNSDTFQPASMCAPSTIRHLSVTDSPFPKNPVTSPMLDQNSSRLRAKSFTSSETESSTLTYRLKQLSQQLECERSNFEASKQSLSQKFKEKEDILKEEIKFQAQANADLEKQLSEIKSKNQQEILQLTNKLNATSKQLQNIENSKGSIERELKSLQSQLSESSSRLQTAERDLNASVLREAALQAAAAKGQELAGLCCSLQAELAEIKTKLASEQRISGDFKMKAESLEDQLVFLEQEKQELNVTLTQTEAKLSSEQGLSSDLKSQIESFKEQLEFLEQEKQELNVGLSETEAKLSSEQRLSNDFKAQVKSLKEEMEFLEQENKGLNAGLIEEMKHKESLELSKKQLLEEMQGKEKFILELERSVGEYKSQNRNNETAMNEYKAKLMVLEKELEQKRDLLSNYEGTNTEQREKLEHFESALSEKVRKLSSVEADLAIKETCISELESKLRSSFDEKQCLETTIENLKSRIETLNKEVSENSVSKEELRSSFETRINELQTQVQELTKKLSISDESLVNAKQALKDTTDRAETLREKLEVLESENRELKEKIEELEKAKQSVDHIFVLLDKEKQDLTAKFQILEIEMESLTTKCEELEAEKQKLADSVEITTLEKEAAMAELENKEKQIRELIENHEVVEKEMNERLENLEKEKHDLSTKKAMTEKEKHDLITMLTMLENEKPELLSAKCETLERENYELTSLCETLSKEKHELADQIKALETNTSEVSYRIDLVAKENFDLMHRCEISRNEILELEGELKKMKEEKVLLEKKLEVLESENFELKVKFEMETTQNMQSSDVIVKNEQEKSELLAEVDNLLKENSEQKERLRIFEEENRKLPENLKTLQEERASMLEEIKSSKISSTELENLKQENVKLREQESTMKEENVNLTVRLDVLERENSGLKLITEVSDTQLESLKKERLQLLQDLQKKELEIFDLGALWANRVADLECRVEKECERLSMFCSENNLQQPDIDYDLLMDGDPFERLQMSIDALTNQFSISLNKNNELQTDLEESMKREAALQSNLVALQEQTDHVFAKFQENMDQLTRVPDVHEQLTTIQDENQSMASQILEHISERERLKLEILKLTAEKAQLSSSFEEYTNKMQDLPTVVEYCSMRQNLEVARSELDAAQCRAALETSRIRELESDVRELKAVVSVLYSMFQKSEVSPSSKNYFSRVRSLFRSSSVPSSPVDVSVLESALSELPPTDKTSLAEAERMEENIISALHQCRFQAKHRLLSPNDLENTLKRHLFLLQKLHRVQKLKKIVTHLDSSKRLLSQISSETLPSKQLQIRTLQNCQHLCSQNTNKALRKISRSLRNIALVDLTIHRDPMHRDVVQSSKFVVYLRQTFGKVPMPMYRSDSMYRGISNVLCVIGNLDAGNAVDLLDFAIVLKEFTQKVRTSKNLPIRYLFDSMESDRLVGEVEFWLDHSDVLGLSRTRLERLLTSVKKMKPDDESKAEIETLRKEYELMKRVNEELKKSVLAEKEKQEVLNQVIEEVERNLQEKFEENVRYKTMLSETNRALKIIESSIGGSGSTSSEQPSQCFCDDCISEVKVSECKSLTFARCFDYIESIGKVVCGLETELNLIRKKESDFIAMVKELEDQKEDLLSELESEREERKLNNELIGDLETVNSQLDEKFQVMEARLTECQDTIFILSEEKRELENILSEKEAEIKGLQSSLETQSNELNEAIAKIANLRCETEKMRVTIWEEFSREKDVQSAEHFQKIFVLEKEMEAKNVDLRAAIDKAKIYEEEIKQLNESLLWYKDNELVCEQKVSELEDKLASKEVELDKAISRADDAEGKIEELKISKNEEIAKYSEKISEIEKRLESNLNELNTSSSKISFYEEEIRGLKQSFASQSEKYSLDISELERKLEKQRSTNNALNETIENIEEDMRNLFSENQNLKERAESLSKEIDSLRAENSTYSVTEKQVHVLTEKNRALEGEIARLKTLKENLKKEKASNDEKMSDMQAQVYQLMQERGENEQVIEDFQSQIAKLLTEKQELEKAHNENLFKSTDRNKLEAEIQNNVHKIKRLEEIIGVLTGENQDIKSRLTQATSDIEKANELVETVQASKHQAMESLEKETSSNAILKQELTSSQSRISELEADLKSFNNEICNLSEKNRVLTQRESELQESIKSLKNQNGQLVQEKRALEAVNEALQKDLDSKCDGLMSDRATDKVSHVLNESLRVVSNLLNVVMKSLDAFACGHDPHVRSAKVELAPMVTFWNQTQEIIVASEPPRDEDIFAKLNAFFETRTSENNTQADIITETMSAIRAIVTTPGAKETTANFTMDQTVLGEQKGGDIAELAQLVKILIQTFEAVKRAMLEKDAQLKRKVKELADVKTGGGAKPEQSKYNLLLLNHKKLGAQYDKLLAELNETKEKVEQLEKDKQELEKEADELAEEIKIRDDQIYNNPELDRVYEMLDEANKKLKMCTCCDERLSAQRRVRSPSSNF